MTVNRLWIARFIFACFALACFSGLAAAQTRMGLVGPGIGWALLSQGTVYSPNDHLFWTSDDGGAWKDITPQDPSRATLLVCSFSTPPAAGCCWRSSANRQKTTRNRIIS